MTTCTLLAPCCGSSPKVGNIEPPSSKLAFFHAATSLILATILTSGAAYASLFYLQLPTPALIAIPCGTAIVSATIFYVAFRWLCGWPKGYKDLLETKKLYSLDQGDEKVKSLTLLLEPAEIATLTAALEAAHILTFSETQLKDKNFPWDQFLEKQGIGKYLRALSTEILLQDHIPWERLPKSEVQQLFSTESRKKSKELLNSFTLTQLTPFIQHLNLDHLAFFALSTLNNEKFPWEHFCTLPGIGSVIKQIHEHYAGQFHLKHVPVKMLPMDEKETLFYEPFKG